MSVQFLGPDPVEVALGRVLHGLSVGVPPRDLERRQVDVKEEAGRRDGAGIRPGDPRSEIAARALAREAACFANSRGGGALVVGVADDGDRVGATLEAEWLRRRIYELSDRRLTVDVAEALLDGVRILVVRIPEALEPVRLEGRIRWRVDDRCVEVDQSSFWSGRLQRLGYDWSGQPSAHPAADARPVALQRARDLLRASKEEGARGMADLPDGDLLRRLDAVTGDGLLTNAGALVLVGRGPAALDYLRRDVAGGDSRRRVREPGRGLVEEVYDVEQAVEAANPSTHVGGGFSVGRLPRLPVRAVREAVVNGLAHRDWDTPSPTLVEHVGARLVVTSPGGFFGGVRPDNIITYPSQPRHRALAELLAALRVAEREGVGVDRMVGDMVRVGLAPPLIEEVAGPSVRVVLLGGDPDEDWLDLLGRVRPPDRVQDLDGLLLLREVAVRGWVDARRAAPVVQRTETEAAEALARLALSTVGEQALLSPVAGVPDGASPAWRLAPAALRRLPQVAGARGSPPRRRAVATDWALARGRVSTTELADLTGTTVPAAGSVLTRLADEGVLRPSREVRVGRGFHYLPVRQRPEAGTYPPD